MKPYRLILAALLVAAAMAGCGGGEEEYSEPEAFSFVVYPGSRYLGQLTEATKNAHKAMNPNAEPPPTAIYDTDATNNLSAAKPPAYYRTGDLQADAKAIEPLLQKMGMPTNVAAAQGQYRAADIEPRPNRPRVTVQRPYFDVTTSQVVDKTLILMGR